MSSSKELRLDDSVTVLAGIGPQMATKLERLHVRSVQDVLFHLPHRYEDRTRVSHIGSLLRGQSAVVIGEIELAQVVFGRRRSLLIKISDGTGSLSLRLFHFSRVQEKGFKRGLWVRCFGEARRGAKGLEMVHPEYRVHVEKPEGGLEVRLTPIYPTTEGVGQSLWRKLTSQVIEQALPYITDLLDYAVLPEQIKQAHSAVSINAALQTLHRPNVEASLVGMQTAQSAAQQRLIFEELLAHHLSLRKNRQARSVEKAPKFVINSTAHTDFMKSLPFELTQAQHRVAGEVLDDITKVEPMMRLVQGDVGSGKTVVAALALLQAVKNDQQAVLMAPTELLAEQHFNVLNNWFQMLEIAVGWLASKTPAKEKKQTLAGLASGQLKIAVGTHALFQESVQYQSLGLVVIDEQHRFGVDQRLALRAKAPANIVPHQLMMTATPIPRTLAMSFYADLDVSSIDELPPGRTPVETVVMSAEIKRETVIERVRAACLAGKQAYWVCPLIDESELLSAQAATDTQQDLLRRLENISVGLVHGRMKPKEKEAAMGAFRNAEISLMVATTVIEVGVDVPNASLMIIENAERMGLSQLHQLRGRVGRGSEKSYCILLYQHPLSAQAKQRLDVIRKTNSGFVIAEKDLEMRGAGELLGTRQTGSLSFKVADILRDQALLSLLPDAAEKLTQADPSKIEPLIQRWIGDREGYINV